ncbi:MAG TPA: hypothetical protein VLE89_07570 [Chlamydiales bacterium]|nr:hypothetical protein [Chlamydiales bacterium]
MDLIYPPLCLECREPCKTKYFCPECWGLCEPPDPAERCRHCFGEVDQVRAMCQECRREPKVGVVRAYVFDGESPVGRLEEWERLAGFAVYQWIRLEWPMPDVIVPMPDEESESVGEAFSALMQLPFAKALRRGGDQFELREEVEGDVLIVDAANPVEFLQGGAMAVAEAFPKRIFLLSLFPDDYFSRD